MKCASRVFSFVLDRKKKENKSPEAYRSSNWRLADDESVFTTRDHFALQLAVIKAKTKTKKKRNNAKLSE